MAGLKLLLLAYSIVIELMNHVYAPAFNAPVDYVRLNLPDYPVKILKPMDLGTVKFRLEAGSYKDPADAICFALKS